MEPREKEQLIDQLKLLEFPASLAGQMDDFDEIGGILVPLKHRKVYGDEVANYTVYARYDSSSAKYDIPRFDLSLRKHLTIPDRVIHGINVTELDRDMGAEDWWSEEGRARKTDLMKQMFDLSQNNHPTGKEAMDKLILKHLADTSYGEEISNLGLIRARYEVQRTFDSTASVKFNAWQAYNLVAGRPVAMEFEQDSQPVYKWFQLNDLAKDFTRMPVIVELEGSQHFNLAEELGKMPELVFDREEEKLNVINALSNGGFALVTCKTADETAETRILTADPGNGRIKYAWREMIRLGMTAEFDLEKAIFQLPIDVEREMEALLGMFKRLGFDKEESEKAIREGIYFGENHFAVAQEKRFGGDVVHYSIQFARVPDEAEYCIPSFTASLRKEVLIAKDYGNDVDTEDLQRRFQEIDWSKQDYLDPPMRRERLLDLIEAPIQAKVDKVLLDLDKLGRDAPDLKALFELKFLTDTPNEKYGRFIQSEKNKTEIRCEFDLNSRLAVNASEAYELLDGRVVEKFMPYKEDSNLQVPGYIHMTEGDRDNNLKWQPAFSDRDLSRLSNQLSQPGVGELPGELNLLYNLLLGGLLHVTKIENGQVINRPVSMEVEPFRVRMEGGRALEPLPPGELGSLARDLWPQLQHLGLEGYERYVSRNIQNGISFFELQKQVEYGNDRALYTIGIALSADKQRLALQTLEVSFLKEIIVPSIQVGEIDTGDLERRMKELPWDKQDYWQLGNDSFDVTYPGYWTDALTAHEIFKDLNTLFEIEDPRGRWIAEALAAKYLSFTPNEYFLKDNVRYEHPYGLHHRFDLTDLPQLTLEQAYNLMEGRSVYLGPVNNGGEQWMNLDFSHLDRGEPSRLEKFQLEKGFDIPHLMGILYESYDDDAETINRALRNGDVKDLSIRFEGRDYLLPVFADPRNSQIRFMVESEISLLDLYLLDQRGWECYTIGRREMGQIRDFNLHPKLYYNEDLFIKLNSKIQSLGFGEGHGGELLYKLNSWYPQFDIGHNDKFGKETLRSVLHFEEDGESRLIAFKSYTVTLLDDEELPKIRLSVNLQPEGNELPEFHYKEALNMAKGGFVYKEEQGGMKGQGHWYGTGSPNGDLVQTVKKYDFTLQEIRGTLKTMPVLELQNPFGLEECLAVLQRGARFPGIIVSGVMEMPGFVSIHPENLTIAFQMASDWMGKGQTYRSPYSPDQGPRDERRRRFRSGGL